MPVRKVLDDLNYIQRMLGETINGKSNSGNKRISKNPTDTYTEEPTSGGSRWLAQPIFVSSLLGSLSEAAKTVGKLPDGLKKVMSLHCVDSFERAVTDIKTRFHNRTLTRNDAQGILERSKEEMFATPFMFLQAIQNKYPENISIQIGEELEDYTIDDAEYAFKVQSLIAAVLEKSLDWESNVQFSWNRLASTIHLKLPEKLSDRLIQDTELAAELREINDQWWFERVSGGHRLVIPTYDSAHIQKWMQVAEEMWQKKTVVRDLISSGSLDLKAYKSSAGEVSQTIEGLRRVSANDSTGETPDGEVVRVLLAKIKNLQAFYWLLDGEYEELKTQDELDKEISKIKFELFCPFHRISGSLKDTFENVNIDMKKDLPGLVPEDLVTTHRQFDAIVFMAARLANPEEEMSLRFGWDENRQSITIDNSDGRLASHIQEMTDYPHLHPQFMLDALFSQSGTISVANNQISILMPSVKI